MFKKLIQKRQHVNCALHKDYMILLKSTDFRSMFSIGYLTASHYSVETRAEYKKTLK